MNRYKIYKKDYDKAKQYIDGKIEKKEAPKWAVKFKDDLTFKKGVLYMGDKTVIANEDVDDWLRKEFYNKESDVPLSRDGAFHILQKRGIVGIPRSRVMKFLKSQTAVESVRNVAAKPKSKGGKRLKSYHFETDLVFVRKPDLVAISKEFESTIEQTLSYIVSTCEVVTGLCRLNFIKKKSATMPVLLKQLESMRKQLGIKDMQKYSGSSDRGEVKIDEIRKIMPWKFVKTATSVEAQNSTIQKTLFKLARMRRGFKLPDLLKQTEKIQNNRVNRIHSKTPNELAENVTEEDAKVQYNKKRPKYKASKKQTKFKVGDHVRILLLTHGKDKGIGHKSYKDKTWSKRVHTVKKVWKDGSKCWVNRKWHSPHELLLTEPIDEKSEDLVVLRDAKHNRERNKPKEPPKEPQKEPEKLTAEHQALVKKLLQEGARSRRRRRRRR